MSNIALLKELGLTEEQIIGKVVDQIADQMLYGKVDDLDYEDVESGGTTTFRKAVDALLVERIDEAVEAVANKHTLPNLTDYLENFCIQKTNQWGEQKGEPVTFVEYLVQRAEAWMAEPVDHSGKSQKAAGSFGFSKKGTRVEYLIDKHLQYNIERAMKAALETANKSIVGGLQEAVNIKLGQIAVQLKTEVKRK